MGLLDVHANGIQSSFDYALRNPGPAEQPASFNLWSFGAAGMRSLAIGGLDTLANVSDLAALTRTADASSVSSSDRTDEEKAQLKASALQDAASLTGWGDSLRRREAEFAPDPLSAHRANQVISGIGSGITKAVGAVSTFGPVAGSVVFGSAQADSAYQAAIAKGIDHDTALKLAGVEGVVSGATAALPAGGSTIARTLGIGVAAGPASFVANEAISRKILQDAHYPEEAAMHDPTDPLGLALSIALPTVMGGLHIRNLPKPAPSIVEVAQSLESAGHRTGTDGQILTSPKGAQGEMQVMPATQTDPGFGVRPAALGPNGKPTPDEIARVGVDYIGAMQNRYGGDPAKTLAAYNAGPGALDAAIAAHGDNWLAYMPAETQAYVAKGVGKLNEGGVTRAAGDPDNVDAARVHLADRVATESLPDHPEAFAELQRATDTVSRGPIVEAMPDPARIELEGQLRTIEAQRSELISNAANLAEPGAIRDARAQLATMEQERPDLSDVRIKALAKQLQAESGASYKASLGKASKQVASEHGDFQRRSDRLTSFITKNADAQRATQALGELDAQHADVTQKLQATPLTSVRPAALRPTAAAARDALMARDSATIKAPKVEPVPKDLWVPRPPEGDTGGDGGATKGPAAATKPAASATKEPAGGSGSQKPEPPSLDAQRADATIAESPDLQVVGVGGTEKVSAAELMQRARSEAQHDLGERDLFRAAVQCALTFGA